MIILSLSFIINLFMLRMKPFVKKIRDLFRSLAFQHRFSDNAAADFHKLTSVNYIVLPLEKVNGPFTFFAIGDAGAPTNELKRTARAMNKFAQEHGLPSVILGLGDNFYKMGVTHVGDPLFQTCWSDVFLKYDTLRVPWRMILGNHDYMGVPQAQIDFTYDKKRNIDRLWQLPSTCYSFNYSVQLNAHDSTSPAYIVPAKADPTIEKADLIQPSINSTSQICTEDSSFNFNIDFFGLDTNGCQKHVARVFHSIPEALQENVHQLDKSLQSSTADWKVVFGHHPMYSQGVAHGQTGRNLRQSNPGGTFSTFSRADVKMPDGFGLEEVLQRGAVSAYFCAHEHVFQHHSANGVHNFMCGASGAELRKGSGLYDGVDPSIQLDWVAGGEEYGFVAATVYQDRMHVRYVSAMGTVLKEVTIQKKKRE